MVLCCPVCLMIYLKREREEGSQTTFSLELLRISASVSAFSFPFRSGDSDMIRSEHLPFLFLDIESIVSGGGRVSPWSLPSRVPAPAWSFLSNMAAFLCVQGLLAEHTHLSTSGYA